MELKKINNIEVIGKTVAVRIDINLPFDRGEFKLNKRIREHAKTIVDLSNRKAKVVLLGHQGRKGKDDFVSLKSHAEFLEKICKKKIEFEPLNEWNKLKERIEKLKEGEILLLENVRFLDEELERPFDAKFIERLSTVCDYFVLDALSVAHREHASVVGLTKHLNSFMGNVLEREIIALEKLKESEKITFIIGGAKVKDSIKIMKYWLSKGRVERFLIGGAPATLFLKAILKHGIGNENEKYLDKIGANEYLDEVKEMLKKHGKLIEIPKDVVVELNGTRLEFDICGIKGSPKNTIPGSIKDIGPKTIERYSRELMHSKIIVYNGPMGVYEMNEFENGTREILNGIVKSKAYSLIGGGHTVSAAERFGIREDNFGYVSLSGKAFLQYLSGKDLPGLIALNK